MYQMKKMEYHDGDTLLEGYCVFDDRISQKKPAVLVAHDWSGRNDFACRKAEKLAELGYIGFAIDMYGKGILGKTKEEKTELMQPLMQNRVNLQKRIHAAFNAVKNMEFVDPARIGAIGFCFGGLCVLDLARSGAALKGAVSFHGLLHAAPDATQQLIKAKILVLHGYSDPMIPPEQLLEFGDEMTRGKVDWQLNIYGNAMHGFTNPELNDPGFGTVYDKNADTRSWTAMREFFREIFGE